MAAPCCFEGALQGIFPRKAKVEEAEPNMMQKWLGGVLNVLNLWRFWHVEINLGGSARGGKLRTVPVRMNHHGHACRPCLLGSSTRLAGTSSLSMHLETSLASKRGCWRGFWPCLACLGRVLEANQVESQVVTGGSWIGELADTMVRTPKAYGMNYEARKPDSTSGVCCWSFGRFSYFLEHRLISSAAASLFKPSLTKFIACDTALYWL